MRVIHIIVDLTEASRNLLHTKVELPVQPNTIALFTTPLWIQESHRDNGPVGGITGLYFLAESKPLRWWRNPKLVSEYHVEIPPGVNTIQAVFDSIITWKVTRRIVMMGWEHNLLYPAHRHVEKIPIQASVIIPKGWGIGTALQNRGNHTMMNTEENEMEVLYHPTTVERLADSPVLAGLHFREFPVGTDQRHFLCVAADTEEYVSVPQDTLNKLARLTEQTTALFGARHYETFRFLIALTDHWSSHGGFEHHDSFDVSLPRKGLSDVENLEKYGSFLAHEFVHSWNGKYRRPFGHVPHDFATPLDGRLLWVYEGLTEYYGGVLSVRSGMVSPDAYRAELARTAAKLEGQTGREWRSVEDTGTGSSLRASSMWANWMRGQDYYDEGVLIWLDVDTLIRSKTGGRCSLDNFGIEFFGRGKVTGPKVIPYTLNDIVSSLNKIVTAEWLAFFQKRVMDVRPQVNTEGIERSGYRFIYTDELDGCQETESITENAIWNSIGVRAGEGGQIEDVRHGSPADIAKLAPRQTIVKVGDAAFSSKSLAAEIKSRGKHTKGFIYLTVAQEDEEWDVELDYQGGLRYPRLERRTCEADMLSDILEKKSLGL